MKLSISVSPGNARQVCLVSRHNLRVQGFERFERRVQRGVWVQRNLMAIVVKLVDEIA